jgi:hypothetical protein
VSRSSLPILAVVTGAAVFVWFTSRHLPEVVASHFAADGAANGFVSHAAYARLVLFFVLALPLSLVIVPRIAMRNPGVHLNLPHADYWLVAERRAATIESVQRYLGRFAIMLVVFLCYAHWLLVRANLADPPRLSSVWLVGGLLAFLAATIAWVISFFGRFRLPE